MRPDRDPAGRIVVNGVSGSLLSLEILRTLASPAHAHAAAARLQSVLARAADALGPASSGRQILNGLASPLARALGFDVVAEEASSSEILACLRTDGRPCAVFAIGSWGADYLSLGRLASASRHRHLRWGVLVNGPGLRVMDRSRIHSRRTLDVDLEPARVAEETLSAIAALFSGDADAPLAQLERACAATDAHHVAVGASLQTGVEEALGLLVAGLARRHPRGSMDAALAEALTIVYRVLFLLFAEARGLVPQWHPVYRRSYTIEALRPKIERSIRPPGVWQALQAIARLAHQGCHAGTLRVVPFNGRLFAPSAAPLADTITLEDRRVRDALLAITTRRAGDRRERISFADLGVEQLGAVYERVLDYVPAVVDGDVILGKSGRRKATGTFYTPRALTEYLVRRTLAPLVRNRAPEDLLRLRVLDPSMGSGAFLVAACRYLADAYEQALIRAGAANASDITPSDRAAFRRLIAQRCLYGVDLNPTAVQLARLSLWLCTLASGKPLTFLDHHLRAGNSLVGAAPRDILRQPPGPGRPRASSSPLPLFPDGDLHERVASTVASRVAIAAEPDDSAEAVRRKERTLAALGGIDAPLGLWRRLADGWCASWFWPPDRPRFDARAWGGISAALQGRASGLPAALAARWLDAIDASAATERFFHWELEFPEVFFDEHGAREDAGFDAVIGNPPWDSLRESARDAPSSAPAALTRFSRESGCYRLQSHGHANLYQLFTERALQLAAPGGRLGLLLPAGLVADHGCARLRREIFDGCRVDALLSFENREAIFPIHRGVKFVLITADRQPRTDSLQSRFGLRSARQLEDIADDGSPAGSVHVPIVLIRKFSGEGLAVPELTAKKDVEIVSHVLSSCAALADEQGWGCRFGRELNATDDRRHFGASGLPVLEGKLLDPFRVQVERSMNRIPRARAARLLVTMPFDRPRLGYREVAAATNRLTLIAAIVPAGTVTTHTIFCLKDLVDIETQWFLCGVFNSFVANYLVRLRGGTHVTSSTIARLPVPRAHKAGVQHIAALARTLSTSDDITGESYVQLQTCVARLYRLDTSAFGHVLDTFPLVPEAVRESCRRSLTSAIEERPFADLNAV
jgi:hypothetical protein